MFLVWDGVFLFNVGRGLAPAAGREPRLPFATYLTYTISPSPDMSHPVFIAHTINTYVKGPLGKGAPAQRVGIVIPGREPRLPMSTYLTFTIPPSPDMFVMWDGVFIFNVGRFLAPAGQRLRRMKPRQSR